MAKQGMKRPERTEQHPKNEAFVPQIQGKARSGKAKANPVIAGTMGADQKVWHEPPVTNAHGPYDNDQEYQEIYYSQMDRKEEA